MWDYPITERFPEIGVPALLVPAGSRDADLKRSAVDAAASALAQSEIRWYEGADHDVHAQHPEAVAADLLALANRAELSAIETPVLGPRTS